MAILHSSTSKPNMESSEHNKLTAAVVFSMLNQRSEDNDMIKSVKNSNFAS